MYIGKHAAKKRRKTGYMRVFVLWSFIVSLLVGAAGFLYVEVLENRIHHPNVAISADEEVHLDDHIGDEPVTFLLLGSDSRDTDDPGRADTIMVLRINPKKKIAHLISIPRDTRVKIPGMGKRKINAAYQNGGTKLMIQTVKDFTGLDINHYAVVNFQGFKEVVDALGGIDIDVEKRLVDPRHNIDIRPGYQHMDGEEALKYVRVRKVDDDFHRIDRQQKFLKAVMQEVMSVTTIVRIPQLAQIASENITTDRKLSITKMIAYGHMFRSIRQENLYTVMIPGTPQTIDGISFVVADKAKVAWILDRVKSDMPLKLTDDERQNENIKVDIRNGSGKAGMAKKMAKKLGSMNFKIREIGNAQSFTYYETQVLASEEKSDVARKVRSQLGFGRVIVEDHGSSQADVLVIVGRDYSRMVDDSGSED
ncbi:MAG: LCP family protein [Actinobacteria bacterium]|nr:LCP family protein [Actinomycetota bacterium]